MTSGTRDNYPVAMFVVRRDKWPAQADLAPIYKYEYVHAQLTVPVSVWGPREGCLLFDQGGATRAAERERGDIFVVPS